MGRSAALNLKVWNTWGTMGSFWTGKRHHECDVSRASVSDHPEHSHLPCDYETHTWKKLGIPTWRLFLCP